VGPGPLATLCQGWALAGTDLQRYVFGDRLVDTFVDGVSFGEDGWSSSSIGFPGQSNVCRSR
jgi:hypothetical protein